MTSPSRPAGELQPSGEDEADALEAARGEARELPIPTRASTPEPSEMPPPDAPGEPGALESDKPKPLQAIVDLLHDLAIAVVVCVLLITYVVQAFKVQGTSMSPELADNERILVNKLLYHFSEIDRDDVVVFWYPEDPDLSFIKRVIGLPGETVEIRAGTVYVDGTRLEEDYVSTANADHRSFPALTVRPGHYFVLGDNRKGSNDSRSWGLVPEKYIYGKAVLKIWPLADMGLVD